jgi:acylphosphatase
MQVHVVISGHVQGVGFRQFLKSNAKKLGVLGWVKNTEDGKVEAVFSADKETLEKMIVVCRRGPFMAEVKDIQVRWEEGEVFPLTDFAILPT